MAMTCQDAMSKNFVTLKKETTISEARKEYRAIDDAVILVTDRKKIVGIVTDSDFLKEYSAEDTLAKIMSSPVITVRAEASLQEAARLMTNNRIGNLPVMKGEEVVGIIKQRDIVKDMIVETKQPKLSPERAAIYLAMTNERDKEEYWLNKSAEEGFKAVITQVGATSEKLPIKLREATIVAAIARGVIKEDAREKIALSNAVRDAYAQLALINPGLGGGFKVAVARGEGRIAVAAFGKCGHALANGPNNLVMGFSII